MVESLLITLREGFEAALIVAIVLAYLRRTGRADGIRAVWAGVAAATLVSLVLGVGLHRWFDGLEGDARVRAFALIALCAAGVLTWMIFWMRRQARTIKGELQGQVSQALTRGSLAAVAGVAFLAVLREGIETALFLTAAATTADDGAILMGGLAGLVLAILIALLIHVGGRHVPLRPFFTATGLLLIVFAAGLVARGVQLLQASGDVGSVNRAIYDLTSIRWLTIDTQTGRFLSGILGWDPRPSLEQATAHLVYLVPVMAAFLRGSRPAMLSLGRSGRSGAFVIGRTGE